MMKFLKSKDRSEMLKFGPFRYPKDFYALADSNLTGAALKKHFEFAQSKHHYDFLLVMRNVTKRNAVALCNQYIPEKGHHFGRDAVNISSETRELVIDNVANLFAHEGNRERLNRRRTAHASAAPAGQVGAAPMVHRPKVMLDEVKAAFEPAVNSVYGRVMADTIGEDKAGKFWRSEMFKSLHAWRKRRFWRRYMPNSQIPVTRLSDEAFAAAVNATNNVATLQDLGMNQADMDDFLDFSDVPINANGNT